MNCKYFFLLICSIAAFSTSAQQILKGQVSDASNKDPMPFVHVVDQTSGRGTLTDLDGRFELELDQRSYRIELSFMGYESRTLEGQVSKIPIEIKLAPRSEQLLEVEIFPGENPAHRIIKNAVEVLSKHDPEQLPQFSYLNYSKLHLTAFEDSIGELFDTLYYANSDSILRIDSTGYEMQQFIRDQHLMMLETVSERQFINGKRDNKKVLATKTSGFKNPLFSLAATELQNFSFYDEYITMAGEEFLNPLTRGSTNRYFFLLEDTTYHSASDTVFHISFRPRPSYGFKPLQGVLFINSSDWALEKVAARPVENIGLRLRIEQEFTAVDGHYFPKDYRAQISVPSMQINESPALIKVRAEISDISTGEIVDKPSRAYLSIADDATDSAQVRLNHYRSDSISKQELRTYTYMDSLFEEHDIEKRLNRLAVLATGKIPLGPVDLELDRILRFNREEAVRLGVGGHTSKSFSKRFKLGGYVGYGFRDESWKYGWDASAILHKPTELNFKLGYDVDIQQSAIPQVILRERSSFLNDGYRTYFADQYDEVTRYYTQVSIIPVAGIEVLGRVTRENLYTRGDYAYRMASEEGEQWQNGFNFFEISSELRYTPNNLFVEGNFGKIELGEKYPQINLRYTRGLSGNWESEFDYHQAHLQAEHRYKTLFIGELNLKLEAGYSTEALPYTKLFTGLGNLMDKDDFWKRNFTLADMYSFETMRFNEFLSSRYIRLAYRQDLGQLIFKRKRFSPHISLAMRALWGNMEETQLHRGIPFKVPRLGYYEAGVEFNRILTLSFVQLGLGVYYRMGPYQLEDTADNIAIKLTSRFGF